MYMRVLALLGIVGTAFGALVTGEILLARSRTYLHDVDFTIERTVGPETAGSPPIEVRVLGDSTAAGVGADTADGALPVLLAERVVRRTGRPVHVVGLGVSGARTADVRTEQLRLVRDADVVVLVVGSNDVIHATPPWRMRAQTAELLAAATASGRPVVLGGIPRFYGVGALAEPLRSIVDAYAGVLRSSQRDAALAQPGVAFVDIAALASPRFLGVPQSMSSDEFHPSAVGYGFWADALAPAVVGALQADAARMAP